VCRLRSPLTPANLRCIWQTPVERWAGHFNGSDRDGSKAHSERDVKLLGPAMSARRMMEPYTLDQGPRGNSAAIGEGEATAESLHFGP